MSEPKNKTMGFDISELDIETYMQTRLRLSRGTIVMRKSRIRIFLQWLQAPLTIYSIEQFFYYLQTEKGLKGSSLNTYLHALMTLESYLVDRKIAKPFMESFQPFKEEDPDIIPLIPQEVQLLKEGWIDLRNRTLAQTYKDFTICLFDTGWRFEDAQHLQCKSVDIIGQQIFHIQLKTGKRKITQLEEPLLSILASRIKQKTPNELVFTNSAGSMIHYPDYYKYLKLLAHSVGITKRVSPHIPRHSYGQNSYDQTGDILLTKELLGHKNIGSTMRYVSTSSYRLKNAQQTHPHVIRYAKPEVTLTVIQNELEKLEKDERFNSLKVKTAINKFIIELTGAIDKNLI